VCPYYIKYAHKRSKWVVRVVHGLGMGCTGCTGCAGLSEHTKYTMEKFLHYTPNAQFMSEQVYMIAGWYIHAIQSTKQWRASKQTSGDIKERNCSCFIRELIVTHVVHV
jgi:hypothetical protein